MNIKFTKDEIEILRIALMRFYGDLEEELKENQKKSEILSKMQKCETLFNKTLNTSD